MAIDQLLCKSIICISIRKTKSLVFFLSSCDSFSLFLFSLSNSSSCVCLSVCLSVCNINLPTGQIPSLSDLQLAIIDASTCFLVFSFLFFISTVKHSEIRQSFTSIFWPCVLIWMLMIIFRYSTYVAKQNETIAGSGVWSSPFSFFFCTLCISHIIWQFNFFLFLSLTCLCIFIADSWPVKIFFFLSFRSSSINLFFFFISRVLLCFFFFSNSLSFQKCLENWAKSLSSHLLIRRNCSEMIDVSCTGNISKLFAFFFSFLFALNKNTKIKCSME